MYQIQLSELIACLQPFLASVSKETNLVSFKNFKKFPNFDISSSIFEQLILDTQHFLKEHKKYSAYTRIELEFDNEKNRNIKDFFALELGSTQYRQIYKRIKEGYQNLLDSKITNRSTFLLYSSVNTFPFDIENHLIDLKINKNELYLNFQSLAFLIQAMDFPADFNSKIKDKKIMISSDVPREELQLFLPNLIAVNDYQKRLSLLENTPFNLSEFVFNNIIQKKSEVPNVFLLNLENNYESQNLIYEYFNNDPEKATLDGLEFLLGAKKKQVSIKKSNYEYFKIFIKDDEQDNLFDSNCLYIPISKDTIPNQNTVLLFLDNNKKYDELIMNVLLALMKENNSLFINPSLEDVLSHPLFAESIPENSVERIKKNIRFLCQLTYKNIDIDFPNIYKFSLILNQNRVNLNYGFYTPLLGIDNLTFSNDTMYHNSYELSKLSIFNQPENLQFLQNQISHILSHQYNHNREAFLNYIITSYDMKIFDIAFEKFLQTEFHHSNMIDFIRHCISSSDTELKKIGLAVFSLKSTDSWSTIHSDINFFINTLYFSHFTDIQLQEINRNFSISNKEIIKNKDSIYNFKEILSKIIIHKGISFEDSSLLDNLSIDFFIALAKNKDIQKTDNPSIFISEKNLLSILDLDNEESHNFIHKFKQKYKNISKLTMTCKQIQLYHKVESEYSKNLISSLIRVERKYLTQEYFDLFINIAPTLTGTIIDNYPINIISSPKNMKKILENCINYELDAYKLYLKVSPDVAFYYKSTDVDCNLINKEVYLSLENMLLDKSVVLANNCSKSILKF